ncbi:Mbov_0401 family ICE element transposase-like protein [Mycoplasma sp. VS30B]
MKFNNITQQRLQLFIDELNHKEEIFRLEIRKKEYPNWKIARRYHRKWVTRDGVFYYNITMYEIKLSNGKMKRFMHYHDDVLKQICKYKYDYQLMVEMCYSYLSNAILGKYDGTKISANHIKYWINVLKIKEKIYQENDELKEKLQLEKLNDNNVPFEIELDDSYSKIYHTSHRNNLCMRQATLHTTSNRKLSKNGVVIIAMGSEKKQNSLPLFSDILKDNVSKFISKNSNATYLKGDGARFIKQISSEVNIQFVLDKFHLIFDLRRALGYTKHSNNPYKNYFKNWYSTTYNARWFDLFEYIFTNGNQQDFYDLMVVFEYEINQKTDLNNEIKRQIFSFVKYVENNRKGIWNSNGELLKIKSYTEHYVYSKCKKHIKKPQAIFGLEMIKLKIMYGNLQNGYCTLFY